LSPRTFYFAEDDPPVRLSLQSAFSTLPNTLVWGFRSGNAFLERADELGPGCVLLDYHMPGMNGVEVLKKLEGGKDKFAFIVLTGHGEVAVAVQAMKAGAKDFLEKPCDFPTLIETVEQALASLEESSSHSARVNEAAAKLNSLSPREMDVLQGLIGGDSNKVIAQNLGISPRTVEIHRAKVAEKLGARNLSDILKIAYAAAPMLASSS